MSEKVLLTADSAADLMPSLEAAFGVKTIPLYINLNGESRKDMLEITPEDIFQTQKELGVFPKTSAIPVGEYLEVFQSLTEDGGTVVHIALSSLYSSCYRNAMIAAEEFPGKVFIVDSRHISAGIALLCRRAALLRDSCKPAQSIADTLEAYKYKIHFSAIVHTLDYLAAGGRFPAVVRLGANALKIRPGVTSDPVAGVMQQAKKYRGTVLNTQLAWIDDVVADCAPRMNNEFAMLVRTPDLPDEIFSALENAVRDSLLDLQTLHAAPIGCMIAANCGPLCAGFAWEEE
ncbi:MAG: DegV family EDD domain-containing protein [Oscillospiraceae bacterium]|nr:DegV family EDD domain-containing protein [Oscillospiraceae bacterium]